MKNKRKLLSLIMTVAMITTLFAGMTISASAANGTWSGGGTAASPGVYADEESTKNWDSFISKINEAKDECIIKLDSDISYEGTSPAKISTNTDLKKIVIDGQGHSIIHDKGGITFMLPVTLKNVKFCSAGNKVVTLNADGESEFYNVVSESKITINKTAGKDAGLFKVYSGQYNEIQLSNAKTEFLPTDSLIVKKVTLSGNPDASFKIVEQDNYSLIISEDGADIVLNNGVFSANGNGSSNQEYLNLQITVSSSSAAVSYTASFGTPSVTTIEPTSEQPFTVPVVMTSESALSGAELDLSCNPEVAKITGVTLAEGLTANGNQTLAADGSSAKISFYGNELSAKDGLTMATVSMQPVAEGTSSLSITKGTAALTGTTLEYPVTVPDSPVKVEVKKQDTIDTQTFVSAVQGGITLVTYTPGTAVAEGMVPSYDGKPMFKGADGSYLCLVKGSADSSKIVTISGTAAEVTHPQKGATDAAPADLNDSGSVNIVDAQIAYDLATGQYTEIADQLTGTTVDMLHWLKADVNGSGSVDASDPRSIQSFIHTNEWFKDVAA